MPDELNHGGVNQAGQEAVGQAASQVASESAAQAGAAQTAASQGAAQAGASGISGVGQSSQAQAAVQHAATVRDVLRQYHGVDFGQQVGDDHQALAALAQVYRQAQQDRQYVDYGREYAKNYQDFQAFLQQKQQASRQQQAQQESWWKAPEYDQSWTQKISRDPVTGQLSVAPGQDPSIIHKYVAWVEHQRNFMDKFSQNPIEAIKPGIEQLIEQKAQALIDQRFGGYEQQNAAKQFVNQNSSWLHQRDQSGQLVVDPRTNMPALSPAGQRFGAYVVEAQQMGMDMQAQQKYATALLHRDVAVAMQGRQQQAGQQQIDPAQASKDQFLSQARAQQQAGTQQTPAAGNVNGSQPSMTGPGALQNAILQEMAAAGFTPGQQLF